MKFVSKLKIAESPPNIANILLKEDGDEKKLKKINDVKIDFTKFPNLKKVKLINLPVLNAKDSLFFNAKSKVTYLEVSNCFSFFKGYSHSSMVKNLTHLDIDDSHGDKGKGNYIKDFSKPLSTFLKGCVNVKYLTLFKLDLIGKYANSVFELQSLKSLRLYDCAIDCQTKRSEELCPQFLLNLEEFVLYRSRGIWKFVVQHLKKAKNLKTLEIYKCWDLLEEDKEKIEKKLDNDSVKVKFEGIRVFFGQASYLPPVIPRKCF